MQCEHCNNNEATFHYTEIVNNNFKEIHLCNECAKKKNFFNSPINFIESQIPQQISQQSADTPIKKIDNGKKNVSSIICEKCRLNFSEFSKRGKFGCDQCYHYFGEELKNLISRIHNSTQHIGKRSVNKQDSKENFELIKNLKQELQTAINNEEYEKAILLRDEIKKII